MDAGLDENAVVIVVEPPRLLPPLAISLPIGSSPTPKMTGLGSSLHV
jgi:hypothetical protein